jgi:hypothetical protein
MDARELLISPIVQMAPHILDGRSIAQPAVRLPGASHPVIEIVADTITHIELHNCHHLGRIISLRQMQGAWPPPDGSYTW